MLLSAVLLTINPLLLITNSSIDEIDENMDSQIKYHTDGDNFVSNVENYRNSLEF